MSSAGWDGSQPGLRSPARVCSTEERCEGSAAAFPCVRRRCGLTGRSSGAPLDAVVAAAAVERAKAVRTGSREGRSAHPFSARARGTRATVATRSARLPVVAAALYMPKVSTGLGAPMSAPHAERYAAFGRFASTGAHGPSHGSALADPPGAVIGAGRGRQGARRGRFLIPLRDQDPLRGESAGAGVRNPGRRLHVVGGSS